MQERDFAASIEAQEVGSSAFAEKSIGDEDILDWKVHSCVSFVIAKKKGVLCSFMERAVCWPTYSNSLCTFQLHHSYAPFRTQRCCGEGSTQPHLVHQLLEPGSSIDICIAVQDNR